MPALNFSSPREFIASVAGEPDGPAPYSFAHATVPVIRLDAGWRLIWTNDAATGLFRTGDSFFNYIGADLREEVRARLAGVGPGALVDEIDSLARDATGHWRFFSWSVIVNRQPGALAVPSVAVAWPCALDRRVAMLGKAAHLTVRECEVLHLIVTACSNASIAARLGISRNTVKNHLKTIFAKTGVGSRGELAARLG